MTPGFSGTQPVETRVQRVRQPVNVTFCGLDAAYFHIDGAGEPARALRAAIRWHGRLGARHWIPVRRLLSPGQATEERQEGRISSMRDSVSGAIRGSPSSSAARAETSPTTARSAASSLLARDASGQGQAAALREIAGQAA